MKIEKVYIGGWFQRTMLQLTEIYDFLRNGESKLALDKKKLLKLRKDLEIGSIDYGTNGLEYVKFTTAKQIEVRIFEDGLIVLNNGEVKQDTLFSDIDEVTDYYENKLSPAVSYLFSLGAPVPKELANIETVYPYFIVLDNASDSSMNELLSKTDKQKYYEFKSKDYDVIRGDKYYFINNKSKNISEIEIYIQEQIFMREFKGQLHRYLNLHRIIWEKIADVKERKEIKGSEIIKFRGKIEGYQKTINLIESRINQMDTYLSTREKVTRNEDGVNDFLGVFGYRYETLRNTLTYIKHLWGMTKNYVNSAMKLFSDLSSDITSKSISNLTIVTSMGVGASLLGLFDNSAPTFSTFGFVYFFILALIGWGVNKIMSTISQNRKYEVSDIDYDKNIK